MRLARVIGTVTMSRKLSSLKPGRYLIVDTLDDDAVRHVNENRRRSSPMPESLIVFDQLGAGVGQIVAVSEGREAAVPFGKEKVPLDAYCAALIDCVDV